MASGKSGTKPSWAELRLLSNVLSEVLKGDWGGGARESHAARDQAVREKNSLTERMKPRLELCKIQETCECAPQSLISIKPIANKRVPGRHRSAQHSVTSKQPQPGKPQRYGHSGEPMNLPKWEAGREKHGLSPEVQDQSGKQQEKRGARQEGRRTHSGRNSTTGLHLTLLPTTHH